MYSKDNKAVKPSGKLRFMSAYRFYRREMVPLVKAERPELEGKQRHQLIRQRWQQLPDDKKFNYVMMSRADREKAIYIAKLIQLKETLPYDIPHSIAKHFPLDTETLKEQKPEKRVFPYTQPPTTQGPVIVEDVDGETSSGNEGQAAKREEGKKEDKFVQLSIV